MDNFIIQDAMKGIVRTREAVRYIRGIETSSLERKYTLAAWFKEHTRAAPSSEQKLAAYDALLGAAENKRLRG